MRNLCFQRHMWLSLLLSVLLTTAHADDGIYTEDDMDHIHFRRTSSSAHLPKRKERSFNETPIEKRTNKDITFTDVVNGIVLKRKKRQTVTNGLADACKEYKPHIKEALKCYHCQSSTKKDKEPVCDHKLWKYLKHSEKTRLRELCDLEAKFCVKIVQQKWGQRITTRGCYADQKIIGRGKRKVVPRDGCVISSKGGYRQTLCLCSIDFCNTSSGITANVFSLLFLSLFVLSNQSY